MMTSFIPLQRRLLAMSMAVSLLTIAVVTDDLATAAGPDDKRGAKAHHTHRIDSGDTAAYTAISGRRSARQQVNVVATGYTAGIESTGKRPGHPQYGITFSGVRVRRGLVSTIAADPKVFPIGTLLFIPGYGFGVVADTGSAIKGKKIDLYFETRKQVFKQWGKRKVTVQLIKKGDGRLTEEWLDALNEAVTAEKRIPDALLKS